MINLNSVNLYQNVITNALNKKLLGLKQLPDNQQIFALMKIQMIMNERSRFIDEVCNNQRKVSQIELELHGKLLLDQIKALNLVE